MAEATTRTPWRLKVHNLEACNCSNGCGCQFNGFPDYGKCEAIAEYEVEVHVVYPKGGFIWNDGEVGTTSTMRISHGDLNFQRPRQVGCLCSGLLGQSDIEGIPMRRPEILASSQVFLSDYFPNA